MKDINGVIIGVGDPVIFIMELEGGVSLEHGKVTEIKERENIVNILADGDTEDWKSFCVSPDCITVKTAAPVYSLSSALSGVIQDAKVVHKRRVKINPIAKHYEKPGEEPYIKYSCPVCHNAGNKNISITEGIPNCPLCGVSLNWDRELQVGDRVVITFQHSSKQALEAGSICQITKIMKSQTEASCKLCSETDGRTFWYKTDNFSILEGDE